MEEHEQGQQGQQGQQYLHLMLQHQQHLLLVVQVGILVEVLQVEQVEFPLQLHDDYCIILF